MKVKTKTAINNLVNLNAKKDSITDDLQFLKKGSSTKVFEESQSMRKVGDSIVQLFKVDHKDAKEIENLDTRTLEVIAKNLTQVTDEYVKSRGSNASGNDTLDWRMTALKIRNLLQKREEKEQILARKMQLTNTIKDINDTPPLNTRK